MAFARSPETPLLRTGRNSVLRVHLAKASSALRLSVSVPVNIGLNLSPYESIIMTKITIRKGVRRFLSL